MFAYTMPQDTVILILSAASIGFFHTLLGPDHYIPFIVLARARKWSLWKSLIITFLCGAGHVGSSILIGLIGILIGSSLTSLVGIETSRGSIAAWMMIAFGLVYFFWGIRKATKNKEHAHLHYHSNGTLHTHKHKHIEEHSHFHDKQSFKELTPWILFIIFIFGPCEPFIPLLLYPAAKGNLSDVIFVSVTFSLTTILTMISIVALSLYGFRFLPSSLNLERFIHAIAGATIFVCGIFIEFLGL